MILLDTHTLVFDTLAPERLSKRAKALIEQGEQAQALACADISLWEIAMLVFKARLDPGVSTRDYLDLALAYRGMEVLAISPAVAAQSQSGALAHHGDPADRLIAATAMIYGATLVTRDRALRGLAELDTAW